MAPKATKHPTTRPISNVSSRSAPNQPYLLLYTGQGQTRTLHAPSRALMMRYSNKLAGYSPANMPIHFPDQHAEIMEVLLRWLSEINAQNIAEIRTNIEREETQNGKCNERSETIDESKVDKGKDQDGDEPKNQRYHLRRRSEPKAPQTSSKESESGTKKSNDTRQNKPQQEKYKWETIARVWVLADDLGLPCIQNRAVLEAEQKIAWLWDDQPMTSNNESVTAGVTKRQQEIRVATSTPEPLGVQTPSPPPSPTPLPRRGGRNTRGNTNALVKTPAKTPKTVTKGKTPSMPMKGEEAFERLEGSQFVSHVRFNPARPIRYICIAPSVLHYVYNATRTGDKLRDLFTDVVAASMSPDHVRSMWKSWPHDLREDVAVSGLLRDGCTAVDWLREMFAKGGYQVIDGEFMDSITWPTSILETICHRGIKGVPSEPCASAMKASGRTRLYGCLICGIHICEGCKGQALTCMPAKTVRAGVRNILSSHSSENGHLFCIITPHEGLAGSCGHMSHEEVVERLIQGRCVKCMEPDHVAEDCCGTLVPCEPDHLDF